MALQLGTPSQAWLEAGQPSLGKGGPEDTGFRHANPWYRSSGVAVVVAVAHSEIVARILAQLAAPVSTNRVR